MFENLNEIEDEVKKCTKCKLCQNRTNTVFGVGNPNADVMFIGEGPGADEDQEGEPFVGKAGKLMNQAFIGEGISREKVYIANIVKCRPPNNRNPEKEEAAACLDYLRNIISKHNNSYEFDNDFTRVSKKVENKVLLSLIFFSSVREFKYSIKHKDIFSFIVYSDRESCSSFV